MIRRIVSFSLLALLPLLRPTRSGAAIYADLCAACHGETGWAAPARR
jgi:cytochrome c